MPPGALARKISARNSQLLFGRIVSSGDWDAATAVPPATAQDGQFWKAISAGVYGGATIPVGALCLFSENLTVVHYLVQEAGPGGEGGGASLLDWDMTPVPGAAIHEVNPFPPEVPVPNDAVIVGDTMTLTIPAASIVYASSKLSATFEAGDKKYFYVRPYAPTGAATLEEYNLILGDGNVTTTPVAQFTFSVGGGITLSSAQLGAPVTIDPAFSLGDAFLVYVDMVAGTVGVKTAAVDTTENIVCPAGTLPFNLMGSGADGAGVAQMDLSSTDLGSGITAPVGYTALSGMVPAGLPVGAVDGDHLKVTVGGTYNAVTYAVDDLAVVLDAGTGTVFPVEEKSVPVPAATWVETYTVTVGVGGLFPDLQALMLDIEDNKRQGDTLGITFTGTALTANDKTLRVPSFKKITLKAPAPMTPPADPNFRFTLDGLANEYIELQGEIRAPNIVGFNVLLVPLNLTGQTGLYATVSYTLTGVYGAQVDAGDPYPYIRCGTSTGAIIRDIGYVRGVTGYIDTSKLEIGFTTANTGTTILSGSISGYIKTNRPISLVSANFNISNIENISASNIATPLVTVVGGSYGRITNLNCGTAGLTTVFSVQYAAVHMMYNITGTYTNLVQSPASVNVFSKKGSLFYDGWTEDQWVNLTLSPAYTSYGPALLKVRSVSDRVDIVCKVNLNASVNPGGMLNVNPIPLNCMPTIDTFVVGTYDDVGGHKSVHLMVRTDGMLQFYGPSTIPDGSEISINTSFYK